MKILPLHEIAAHRRLLGIVMVKSAALSRGVAADYAATTSMLTSASRSQYFLSRVFHLEFVAHGGWICFRDHNHILC